jgi:hypothetical protein
MPPLSVRVQVARRQVEARARVPLSIEALSLARQLRALLASLRSLWGLPDDAVLPLDHNPALILRKYNPRVHDVAARYTPHAHDPAALQYRSDADHDFKTFGRKPGAAKTVTTKGSDIWLKSKFNRLEGKTKKRPKQKIRSRGFGPQKRKFDGRRK